MDTHVCAHNGGDKKISHLEYDMQSALSQHS
jgi:hypothetical protein